MNLALKRLLCGSLIAACAWAPLAQAGMIGTGSATAGEERAAILAVVTRAEVAAALQSLGVDAERARERVAAMTEAELHQLAGRLSALPAAGDPGAVFLVVAIVAFVLWQWWHQEPVKK